MAPPTTKDELLATIETARQRLEAVLFPLSDDQLRAPLLEDGWSVQDILAHITFWEGRMRYGLSHDAVDGKPALPPEIVDIAASDDWLEAINHHVYQHNHERNLADVRNEFRQSYRDSVALLETLEASELFDPSGLIKRIGRDPLDLIAGNTYEHYDEHAEAIERAFPPSA